MKPTLKALEEQETYKLLANDAYKDALAEYLRAAMTRKEKFGYYVNKDTATRNMLKALRMSPWHNSPDDWARLHATETLMKAK